jgi:DNA polymerase delta subunit 4
MPPKSTRSRRAAPSTVNQSTLSFKNRITKSTSTSRTDDSTKPKTRLSDAAEEEAIEQISTPDPEPATIEPEAAPTEPEAKVTTSPAQPRKKKRISTASTASTAGADRETKAAVITDAQIAKWWKAEEKERRAPRGLLSHFIAGCDEVANCYTVHQSSVPVHEKILRHFDLSGQYGSCIGITRMNRWKRANGLGLEPPLEVMAVLLREHGGTETKKGAKNKGKNEERCGELAYIDELAGGRIVSVEG